MTLCLWLFFVQFKQSFLAGLFWFHSSFADYPYVTYVGVFFLRIRFMSQFFPLFTQSHKHTICSSALYVFLSFSPVEFVSVLFAIATHCHKKQFVLNNTSAFSRSPNDYLLMSRFTKKKNRGESATTQIEHASTKSACKNTDFYTTHCHETGMQRAMQCTPQNIRTHNNCEKKPPHTVQLQELQFINIFYVRRSI